MSAQGTYDLQHWSTGNLGYDLRLQTVWNNSGITQKFVQRFNGTDYPMLAFYQGRVGIGIANPGAIDATLAVKGNIHTQEVIVDVQGAVVPDYVFEDSYPLLSLEEIEKFIAVNKHLPEVPSADVFEKNGMELKQMNLLLLKKIEELTLHMINQEKEKQMILEELTALKIRIDKIEVSQNKN